MSKRILVAVAALAVVTMPVTGAGATSPHGKAKGHPKPPPLPKCLTYADPAGDSGLAPGTTDPALEITSVRLSTGADRSLSTAITVAKYADRPLFGTGNRFQVTFTAAEHVIDVYYKLGPARDTERNAFYQSGVRVDGAFVTDAVKGAVKGNTVTLTVTLATLRGAAGKAVEGAKATGITAYAMSSYVATNETWDSAAAPTSFTIGGACV